MRHITCDFPACGIQKKEATGDPMLNWSHVAVMLSSSGYEQFDFCPLHSQELFMSTWTEIQELRQRGKEGLGDG